MEKELTLVAHLGELRQRLIICLSAVFLTSLVGFYFSSYIVKFLKNAAGGAVGKLFYFSPQEAFGVYLKVSLFFGLFVSMPVIIYEIWAFVSPALEGKFKKGSLYFILLSCLAFFAGCVFSYRVLLPSALKFLLSFGTDELVAVLSATRYISFVVTFIFLTGLVFEMPVVSFLLSKMGILNYRFMRKNFKYAVVFIFILAAVITPTTDIFNMLILAVPMLFLYEVSIWVSFFARPRIK